MVGGGGVVLAAAVGRLTLAQSSLRIQSSPLRLLLLVYHFSTKDWVYMFSDTTGSN